MRLAAINYFKDYPSYLPLKSGESKKVIVSSLVKEGYIEKITDINNNNKCDSMKSYVKVVKNSKDTYTYSSYLVCPNYKVKKVIYRKNCRLLFSSWFVVFSLIDGSLSFTASAILNKVFALVTNGFYLIYYRYSLINNIKCLLCIV